MAPVGIIDWDKVRKLMAMAIRGRKLSEGEMVIINYAWKYHPNTYSKVHAEEKRKADAEMNPLAGKG